MRPALDTRTVFRMGVGRCFFDFTRWRSQVILRFPGKVVAGISPARVVG
jgi:hypothetical protein